MLQEMQPVIEFEALPAQNGAKLRTELVRERTVSAMITMRKKIGLKRMQGEKKKRLKREKEVLASRAESSTQRAPSDQATTKAMENTSSETNADQDMTHDIPDEEGIRKVNAVDSAAEQNGSDLCPAVTTEQRSRCVVFPEPKIRKIRTVMPFDMSDPFKFRGTQMSWEPIDMKTVSVSARKMAESE